MKTRESKYFFGIKLLIIFGAALVFTVLSLTIAFPAEEDAFIYYRYALNWAQGRGLVFNPGERVEGYSSPLWMAILAFSATSGLHLPEYAPLLGIACGALTVMGTYFLSCYLGLGSFSKVAVISGLAVFYPFIVWSRSGIETPLYSLSIVAFTSFYLAERTSVSASKNIPLWPQFIGGIGIAFIALCRPEGILIIFPVAVDRLCWNKDRSGFLRYLIPAVLIYGIFLAWRYTTYGSLTPNTSVKIHPDYLKRSLTQILSYFAYLGGIILIIPIMRFVFPQHQNSQTDHYRLSFLSLIVFFLAIFYTLAVGGDYRPHFRFLVPLTPLVLVIFWKCYETSGIETRRWLNRFPAIMIRFVILISIVLLSIISIVKNYSDQKTPVFSILENTFADSHNYHNIAAQWIIEHVPTEKTVAFGQMGKAPYYSMIAGKDIRFIDTLGLVDREIGKIYRFDNLIRIFLGEIFSGESLKRAAEKGREKLAVKSSEYIISRRPDFIIIESIFANSLRIQTLLSNRRFRRRYTFIEEIISGGKPLFLVYAKKPPVLNFDSGINTTRRNFKPPS